MNEEISKLQATPIVWKHKPDDPDYPGYWISLRDVTSEQNEELILFMGLNEESCKSIYNRFNLFLENWLYEYFGI